MRSSVCRVASIIRSASVLARSGHPPYLSAWTSLSAGGAKTTAERLATRTGGDS